MESLSAARASFLVYIENIKHEEGGRRGGELDEERSRRGEVISNKIKTCRGKIHSSSILIVEEGLTLMITNYEWDLGEHVFGFWSFVVEISQIFHRECISY